MILALLERLGRKSMLVDGYGRVRMERYDLLWKEEERDGRPWPNVWLHHYPMDESPDAKEDPHQHPWSTLAVVLRGGYVEVVNWAARRTVRWFSFLSHKDNHRLDSVKKGTWSLFSHWFRRQPWTFHFKPCAKLCSACEEKGASCFKVRNPTMELGELFERGGDALQWIRATPESTRKLRVLQRALERKGIRPPPRDAASAEYRKRIA
jgi:hypothetical protein